MRTIERDSVEANVYIRLEVDPEVVARAPKVSILFKQAGGQDKVWEALDLSDSPDARKLVRTRALLNQSERAVAPFEAIALSAGMTTKHAFGVVAEAIIEASQDASRILLHTSMPEVMQASIDHAKKPDGVVDRRMLMQSTGLATRPKGSITVVQGDVIRGNKMQTVLLPASEDLGRQLHDRFALEMQPLELESGDVVEGEPDAAGFDDGAD